jgi:hypothetical protein
MRIKAVVPRLRELGKVAAKREINPAPPRKRGRGRGNNGVRWTCPCGRTHDVKTAGRVLDPFHCGACGAIYPEKE